MTRHEYVADAIRRRLNMFNAKHDGNYSQYIAKAALEALRDPRYAHGEQVTVNRALLLQAMAVPPYVLDAPDDRLWVLMERPASWAGAGQVSTHQIKALRYAAAMNE